MPKNKKGPRTFAGKVKRIVNAQIETKNIATTINYAAGSAVTSNNPTPQLVCQIAQGDNINDREGNVIKPQHIQIRIASTMTLATVQTMIRTIIFKLKQSPTNAVPTNTNILAVLASDLATVSPYTSGPVSNKYFDIVYDKSFIMCSNSQTSHHETINLYPKHAMHYVGAGATDGGKDQYWMLTLSNQPGGAGASPYTNIGVQVWYKDG